MPPRLPQSRRSLFPLDAGTVLAEASDSLLSLTLPHRLTLPSVGNVAAIICDALAGQTRLKCQPPSVGVTRLSKAAKKWRVLHGTRLPTDSELADCIPQLCDAQRRGDVRCIYIQHGLLDRTHLDDLLMLRPGDRADACEQLLADQPPDSPRLGYQWVGYFSSELHHDESAGLTRVFPRSRRTSAWLERDAARILRDMRLVADESCFPDLSAGFAEWAAAQAVDRLLASDRPIDL